MDITAYLFMAIAWFMFFGIPIISVILFFVFLIRYISAKRTNRVTPELFSNESVAERKTAFIAVSIICAVLLAIDFGILLLIGRAIAYM